jgi:hypothetical protein
MNIDPIKYTLICWQGKTFEKIFYFKDAQDNIINLSGYTARMHIRPAIDSDTITIELNTENDRIIINGDDGSVTLYIADEDSEGIDPGTYKYDLEIISASGRVYCPIYGSFKVKAEVTRSA